jgi:hypothetical protein
VVGPPRTTEGAVTATAERSGHHGGAVGPATAVDTGTDAGHHAGDLVTEDGAGRRQLAGQMEITAADPAPGDPQECLAGTRDR